MRWYKIEKYLLPLDSEPTEDTTAVVLLSSNEIAKEGILDEFGSAATHIPSAQSARLCKAEVHAQCLAGTLVLPSHINSASNQAYGYLITKNRIVLVDDADILQTHLQHLADDKLSMDGHIGILFYELIERLRASDLNRLEELEDRIESLEEDVLSDKMDSFNTSMKALRKETMMWFRYYTQLDDMVCELQENENGFFSEAELSHFHLLEERCSRLREEAQLLREYCVQVQGMFQAEIDILQNRVMKILTIVTVIFLPLTLLVGWYGMNFVGMPELKWKCGYPVIIAVSIIIVIVGLWICKRKKFL